jgi:hypothetical protein
MPAMPPRDPLRLLAALALVLAAPAIFPPGCAVSPEKEAALSPAGKLRRVGLEIIDERDALVPPAERGRALPVRTIAGFPEPALPEDPAGYFIVGVEGKPADAAAVLRAVAGWDPGETLPVTVRRNPHVGDAGWWEAEVRLVFPPAGNPAPGDRREKAGSRATRG